LRSSPNGEAAVCAAASSCYLFRPRPQVRPGRRSVAPFGCGPSQGAPEAQRLRHALPTVVRLILEATQVDRRRGDRAMTEQPADRLDAGPALSPQLGRGVPKDVRRHACQAGDCRIAPEVGIPGAVRNRKGTLAFARDRNTARLGRCDDRLPCGIWELASAYSPALRPDLTEDTVSVRRPGEPQTHEFGPTEPGQDRRDDESTVEQSHRRLGDDGEQPADLSPCETPRSGSANQRPSNNGCRVRLKGSHPHREAEEAADGGEPRQDRRRGRWTGVLSGRVHKTVNVERGHRSWIGDGSQEASEDPSVCLDRPAAPRPRTPLLEERGNHEAPRRVVRAGGLQISRKENHHFHVYIVVDH
jgi:hypothetical protein